MVAGRKQEDVAVRDFPERSLECPCLIPGICHGRKGDQAVGGMVLEGAGAPKGAGGRGDSSSNREKV